MAVCVGQLDGGVCVEQLDETMQILRNVPLNGFALHLSSLKLLLQLARCVSILCA
jgi:hypothetical protein